MTERAVDVANYLTRHFHYVWDTLGFFDLQRLMYLAQGWHLATSGKPLFMESITAHRAAPLVLAVKGVVPLAEMLPDPELSPAGELFLDNFCITYGIADSKLVKQQVDREDGAWRLAEKMAGEGAVIHHDLMAATFRLMLLDHAETSRKMRAAQVGQQVARAASTNVVAFRQRG